MRRAVRAVGLAAALWQCGTPAGQLAPSVCTTGGCAPSVSEIDVVYSFDRTDPLRGPLADVQTTPMGAAGVIVMGFAGWRGNPRAYAVTLRVVVATDDGPTDAGLRIEANEWTNAQCPGMVATLRRAADGTPNGARLEFPMGCTGTAATNGLLDGLDPGSSVEVAAR